MNETKIKKLINEELTEQSIKRREKLALFLVGLGMGFMMGLMFSSLMTILGIS